MKIVVQNTHPINADTVLEIDNNGPLKWSLRGDIVDPNSSIIEFVCVLNMALHP